MTATLEGGEWSAARPGRTLPPGKTRYPFYRRLGGPPGPLWTGGKSRPNRDSIPDRPARSQSLYRLSYPVHVLIVLYFIKYSIFPYSNIINLLQVMLYCLYHFGMTKVCKHFCDLSPCRSWLTHEVNSSLRLLETRQQCNDFVLRPALAATDEGFQLPAKYTFVLTGINEFRGGNVTNTHNCWKKSTSPMMSLEHPWPFSGKYQVRMSALMCLGYPKAPIKYWDSAVEKSWPSPSTSTASIYLNGSKHAGPASMFSVRFNFPLQFRKVIILIAGLCSYNQCFVYILCNMGVR